jgi:hypothetical protein
MFPLVLMSMPLYNNLPEKDLDGVVRGDEAAVAGGREALVRNLGEAVGLKS